MMLLELSKRDDDDTCASCDGSFDARSPALRPERDGQPMEWKHLSRELADPRYSFSRAAAGKSIKDSQRPQILFALGDGAGKLHIFCGDGKGNFKATRLAAGPEFDEAKVVDLNGNGRRDTGTKPYNYGSPRVYIFMNLGPKDTAND